MLQEKFYDKSLSFSFKFIMCSAIFPIYRVRCQRFVKLTVYFEMSKRFEPHKAYLGVFKEFFNVAY